MVRRSKGRVLVTGLHGFTGLYLKELLEQRDYEVAGLVQGAPRAASEYQVDLRDRQAVAAAVATAAPDYVVHLAAISFVAHSDTGEIYDVNVKGTLHLVEAVGALPRPPRKLLLASSGNVYGPAAGDAPATEATPPQPQNHYAISKCAAEQVVALAAARLPAVIARPFNYTGVGQAESFIVPKLVAGFRQKLRRLKLGNIDTVRDISDVRWLVQAYVALLESDFSGTVNVCSGRGICMRDVLGILERLAGYRMEVETDPALLRGREIPRLVGSPAKLEELVSLPARPSFEATLEWMYRAA